MADDEDDAGTATGQRDPEAADYLPSAEIRVPKGARGLRFPGLGSRPTAPPPLSYSEALRFPPPSMFEQIKMPKVHNPTFDVLEQSKSTNELLAQMLDIAQADAALSKAEARTARIQTWIAIGVTVAVGLVQIVLAIIHP